MRTSQLLRSAGASLLLALSGCAHIAGWAPDPAVVRTATEQQPAFNYEESRVPRYTVPPVLAGGRRAHTRAAWVARRAEILELFRAHVYGRSPGRPESIRFEVLEENPRA